MPARGRSAPGGSPVGPIDPATATSRPLTSRASRANLTPALTICSNWSSSPRAASLSGLAPNVLVSITSAPGGDEGQVQAQHLLGREQVGVLRAAGPRHGRRQQRAHAPVGHQRLLSEAIQRHWRCHRRSVGGRLGSLLSLDDGRASATRTGSAGPAVEPAVAADHRATPTPAWRCWPEAFTSQYGRARSWAWSGPSGCGKSTLLHLVAGLEQPLPADTPARLPARSCRRTTCCCPGATRWKRLPRARERRRRPPPRARRARPLFARLGLDEFRDSAHLGAVGRHAAADRLCPHPAGREAAAPARRAVRRAGRDHAGGTAGLADRGAGRRAAHRCWSPTTSRRRCSCATAWLVMSRRPAGSCSSSRRATARRTGGGDRLAAFLRPGRGCWRRCGETGRRGTWAGCWCWPALIAAWQAYVRLRDVPQYVLPAPSDDRPDAVGRARPAGVGGGVTAREMVAGFAVGARLRARGGGRPARLGDRAAGGLSAPGRLPERARGRDRADPRDLPRLRPGAEAR